MGIGPILDSEVILKKRAFFLLAPPKQMPFLTISNKNIFFKTKGTRLSAIVAPNVWHSLFFWNSPITSGISRG